MRYLIEHMPQAYVDLDDVLAYFSRFYPSTPKKFLDEYLEELDLLSYFPEMHKKWWGDADYHVFYVRYYGVFYKVDHDSQTVWIHRIINARRDFISDIEVMEELAQYGMESVK